jgi:hypothetical protein
MKQKIIHIGLDVDDTLSRRIVRVLERRGLLIADPECLQLDIEPNSSLNHLQAASINARRLHSATSLASPKP